MKFAIKNKEDGRILYTGTKQECMHHIKRNRLDRQTISLDIFDNKPTYHTTVPVVEDKEPPKQPFFKRLFSK